MEKYFGKLIEDYDKVLSEEVGEGKLKKRLLGKLEEIISGNNLSENFQENSQVYLDEEIKRGDVGCRIYNWLIVKEIKTYRDLIKICHEDARRHVSSTIPYLDCTLLRSRNFGKKSLERLKEHLKSVNFDFSEEFAKNVVEGRISQENFLDKPFDYNALPKYKTRVKNVLKPVIETYGELQEKCYKNFADKNGGNRSWQGEREYSFFLGKYRCLGRKSVDSVISHLREINFDFSEESAKKTFEKSGK